MVASRLRQPLALPLPLVIHDSDDPWTCARIKHECHIPGLQTTTGAARLEHRTDVGKRRELREFRREPLFTAIEVTPHFGRQVRQARGRNERVIMLAGSDDRRRRELEAFPCKRRASRTAFGAHIEPDGIAQRYPIEGNLPLQECDDTPSSRVEGGSGAPCPPPGAALPDLHTRRRVEPARCGCRRRRETETS